MDKMDQGHGVTGQEKKETESCLNKRSSMWRHIEMLKQMVAGEEEEVTQAKRELEKTQLLLGRSILILIDSTEFFEPASAEEEDVVTTRTGVRERSRSSALRRATRFGKRVLPTTLVHLDLRAVEPFRYPTRGRVPTGQDESAAGPDENVRGSGRTMHGDTKGVGDEGDPRRQEPNLGSPQPALEEPGPPAVQPVKGVYSCQKTEETHLVDGRGMESLEANAITGELNPEQARAVDLARRNMTVEEHKRVSIRAKARTLAIGERPISLGVELHPEIQKDILDGFKRQKDLEDANLDSEDGESVVEEPRKKSSKKKNMPKKGKTYSPALGDKIDSVAELKVKKNMADLNKEKEGSVLRPINQVSRRSALGKLFTQIRRKHDDDSSDSSSDSSDDESDYHSDSSSDSSTEPSHSSSSAGDSSDDELSDEGKPRCHKCKHQKSSKRGSRKVHERRKSKKSKRRSRSYRKPTSMVKPIPPEKYNVASDIQKFMQFINQCSAYLTDGYVEQKRHITVIASFLTGKAWNFYSGEVLRRS
ncbi:hypothetical protein C0995_014847 [Termitomyces sp. Mi166|nr:hypothetical protein C0995_014847 [Termitomyces sp. Mi166\